MRLRNCSLMKQCAIGICVCWALYCEWLVYLMQPLYWPTLACPQSDNTCKRILFIADPQLQGEFAVPFPLNYIFYWDSDRYLKSTFSVVVNSFKPEVLVYLGDLMDEGSISTTPQFHSYAKRLFEIFSVEFPVTQVWLPGDNDIGGENEPIMKDKVNEFDKIFKQPSVITYKNIYFFKVNGITHVMPDNNLEYERDDLRIVVSHYPITPLNVFRNRVNKTIAPHIYFCAHDHSSKYAKMSKDFQHRHLTKLESNEVLEIQFTGTTDLVYEVYVPTCSYRMGTSKIGYGAAIIGRNNNILSYTVLWSPQRFPYLLSYLVLIVLLIFTFSFRCIFRFRHQYYMQQAKRLNQTRSNDAMYLINSETY